MFRIFAATSLIIGFARDYLFLSDALYILIFSIFIVELLAEVACKLVAARALNFDPEVSPYFNKVHNNTGFRFLIVFAASAGVMLYVQSLVNIPSIIVLALPCIALGRFFGLATLNRGSLSAFYGVELIKNSILMLAFFYQNTSLCLAAYIFLFIAHLYFWLRWTGRNAITDKVSANQISVNLQVVSDLPNVAQSFLVFCVLVSDKILVSSDVEPLGLLILTKWFVLGITLINNFVLIPAHTNYVANGRDQTADEFIPYLLLYNRGFILAVFVTFPLFFLTIYPLTDVGKEHIFSFGEIMVGYIWFLFGIIREIFIRAIMIGGHIKSLGWVGIFSYLFQFAASFSVLLVNYQYVILAYCLIIAITCAVYRRRLEW